MEKLWKRKTDMELKGMSEYWKKEGHEVSGEQGQDGD